MSLGERNTGSSQCARHRLGVPHALLRAAAWLTRRWFTAGACAVVVNGDGEVLLVRSRLRPGAWGLPGGFLKRRESPEMALRRELAEELGLTGPYAVEAVDQYLQEHASHLEFLYRVHLSDGFVATPRDPVEIAEASWFRPDQLPALLPETVLALRKASQRGCSNARRKSRPVHGDRATWVGRTGPRALPRQRASGFAVLVTSSVQGVRGVRDG